MNWIDLIILIIVFSFSINGLKKGFFVQLVDIAGFLIALVFSLTFYPLSASFLIKLFNLPKIAANPVGFLMIWIIVETLFYAFFNPLFNKIITKFAKTKINIVLGIFPAVINAFLFLSFALLFIVSLPIRPDIKNDVFKSKIGGQLVTQASFLEKPFTSIFGPIAKQSLTFLTVKPEEKGTIPLEYTQKDQTIDYQAEQQLYNLVNSERQKAGVKPLEWDESLAIVGRNHSADMFKRGYFSHYSPEGKDVGDRLIEVGINYSYAGENLALAPTTERAHTGLMNSPGHKRNILDPAFAKIGIGAIDGGVYGKMFTQVFTN